MKLGRCLTFSRKIFSRKVHKMFISNSTKESFWKMRSKKLFFFVLKKYCLKSIRRGTPRFYILCLKYWWLKFQDFLEIRREMKIPLSMCFTAYKDDEYFGKGEENLKFSGCSLNTMDMMDPKWIIILNPWFLNNLILHFIIGLVFSRLHSPVSICSHWQSALKTRERSWFLSAGMVRSWPACMTRTMWTTTQTPCPVKSS